MRLSRTIIALCLTLPVASCDGGGDLAIIAIGANEAAPKAVPMLTEAAASAGVTFDLGGPQDWGAGQVPSAEEAVARTLTQIDVPELVAAVGPSGSRGALAVLPMFRDSEIPLILPVVTTNQLDDAGPWVFRMVPSNRAQGVFLARYARDSLRARSATLYYVSDEYGTELRVSIDSTFTAMGGVVLDQVPLAMEVTGSDNDYDLLVAQASLRGEPDVIFLAGRPAELAEVMKRTADLFPDAVFLATDGAFRDQYMLNAAPRAASRYFRVMFWHSSLPEPRSQAFVQRFKEAHGSVPSDAEAVNYDAVELLVEAVRAVGADRDEIRRYLGSLGGSRSPYVGVSGPVAFTGDRGGNLLLVHVAGDSVVAGLRQ